MLAGVTWRLIMKPVSKSLGMLVLGVAIGSLPYTLSMGRINAQDVSRLKPKHVPAHIDHISVDNFGNVIIASGSRIYKISSDRLNNNGWWTMPELPAN